MADPGLESQTSPFAKQTGGGGWPEPRLHPPANRMRSPAGLPEPSKQSVTCDVTGASFRPHRLYLSLQHM
ncbi:unnamed protein product [Nezara viridula]|uniref:Uncharacterized protein n=1 Tax=Nezara viridula TaxID=85310 RepID=A0A9P0H1D4_NEZVI|nr:unnamed protein product [Nezara viridula]